MGLLQIRCFCWGVTPSQNKIEFISQWLSLLAVSCVHLSWLLPTFTTVNEDALDECNVTSWLTPVIVQRRYIHPVHHMIYLSGRYRWRHRRSCNFGPPNSQNPATPHVQSSPLCEGPDLRIILAKRLIAVCIIPVCYVAILWWVINTVQKHHL